MTVTRQPTSISGKEDVQALIDRTDNFLFDCDGVIWLGDKLIDGVAESISLLKSLGKNIVFITNNSSTARVQYVEKFKRLGITGVTKDQIYPTSYSAVCMLLELGIPRGSKVWLLGENGIEVELKEAGYVPLGGTDERLNEAFYPEHELLVVDPEVKAVIVGASRDINFMRISSTLQYLMYKEKSLPFVGTNIDRTYPGPNGLILPAGGSLVNFMAYTSDRKFIDVGKPSSPFLNTILTQNKFDKSRTLMAGDTLYTDIKFGNDGQLGTEADGGTLLVLTGGTKRSDLTHLLSFPHEYEDSDGMIPHYVMDSFGHLAEYLK